VSYKICTESIGGTWAIAPEGSSPLWVKSCRGAVSS
jgi:hypothetical protein